MKFEVWKVAGRKSEKVATFATKAEAESFAEFASATVRVGTRYVVREG